GAPVYCACSCLLVLDLFSVSLFFFYGDVAHRDLHSFPTRRSSDLELVQQPLEVLGIARARASSRRAMRTRARAIPRTSRPKSSRSEEHTSELQSPYDLVCRLLLEKKNASLTTFMATSPDAHFNIAA